MATLPRTRRVRAAALIIVLLLIAAGSLVGAAPEILGVYNFNCNTGGRCVEVTNNGSGIGVFGYTKGGTNGAVRGVSPDNNLFGVGVVGKANFAGVKGESVNGWGVWGHSTNGIGVYGYTANSTAGAVRGVAADSLNTGIGVYGEAAFSGVYGEGAIGVYGSGSSKGVYGVSDTGDGIYGQSTGDIPQSYGGSFRSIARGIDADGGSGHWDGLFYNCVRIGGIAYGSCPNDAPYSAGMSVIAVNGGAEALAPGDLLVFQGMGAMDGVPDVVLLVDKAAGVPGEVVIGVMKDAYVLEPAVDDAGPAPAPADLPPMPETISDSGRFAEGNAEPGGLLFVQIDGIALVNVSGPVAGGATLTAGATGRAVAAPAELVAGTRILGMALESAAEEGGAVFVLLGVR